MAIKTIPRSRLETDLKKTLDECAKSGQMVVVEMPDQRLLAIQPLDPQEDDSLMDELLVSNPIPSFKNWWQDPNVALASLFCPTSRR